MKKFLTLTIFIVLTACATPYQKKGYITNMGFNESKMSKDSYIVDFIGNTHLSLEKANEYNLLRSAEVSKLLNHNFFSIEEEKNNYLHQIVTSCYNGICSSVPTQFPYSIRRIKLQNEGGKDKKLNADEIIKSIREKYKITSSLVALDDKAKKFKEVEIEKPQKGYAMVYVIRNNNLGALLKYEVYVDDPSDSNKVGHNRINEYINFEVDPGKHKIYSRIWTLSQVSIDVKEGDIIFIAQGGAQHPYQLFIDPKTDLSIINEMQAKFLMQDLKLGKIDKKRYEK